MSSQAKRKPETDYSLEEKEPDNDRKQKKNPSKKRSSNERKKEEVNEK